MSLVARGDHSVDVWADGWREGEEERRGGGMETEDEQLLSSHGS